MKGKLVLYGRVEELYDIERRYGFQYIRNLKEWEHFLSGSSEVALVHATTAEQAVRRIEVDFGATISDAFLFLPVSELQPKQASR